MDNITKLAGTRIRGFRKEKRLSQEELAEKLNESGFQVSQATVSRDIRELKLTKISKPGGGSRYAVLQSMDQEMSRKYTDVLRTSFQSMDLAQNILVV